MAQPSFDPVPDLFNALGTSVEDDLEKASQTLIDRYGLAFAQEYGLDSPSNALSGIQALYTWVPDENFPASKVYEKLCAFYLFFDTSPLYEKQTPLVPNAYPDQLTPLSKWIIDYSKSMGHFLSQPQSITPATARSFIDSPAYHMATYFQGGQVPDGEIDLASLGWDNFNKFFSRRIPDIDIVRPVAVPQDDKIIVSPADFTFGGFWPIDADGTVCLGPEKKAARMRLPLSSQAGTAVTKGIAWPIEELLGPAGKKYANEFKGGVFAHGFLSPHDYHRQHAPVSGKVVYAGVIPGLCYLEVKVRSDMPGNTKILMERYLDAPDAPGYQFVQARGLILIDNPTLGLVAMLPIGMAQVSSVVLNSDWPAGGIPVGGTEPPTYVKKGDEVSHFEFGGSDTIVCFTKKANIKFNAYNGDWMRVRSQLGFSST